VNSAAETRHYHAYLLRLWQASEGEAVMWRALLEDPRTGERRGFADLDSLFAFLLATCREGPSGDEAIPTTH
jgi:hypothetical protein